MSDAVFRYMIIFLLAMIAGAIMGGGGLSVVLLIQQLFGV